jgi:acyl-CoA synthetase (NDP forming)
MVEGFGCSKCINSGNEADLHCEDYLEYLAEDPQTRVILSYIKGLKDGCRFFHMAKR